MKTAVSFISSALLLAMVAGCMEERDVTPVVNPDGNLVIKFAVGGSEETKAGQSGKAAEQIGRIRISEPEDSDQLFLVETVESMDAAHGQATVDTKGIPVYTENFVQIHHDINGIPYEYTADYHDMGTSAMTGGNSLLFGCIDESKRIYAYDFGTKTWPEGKNLLFFLSAPVDMANAGVTDLKYSQDKSDPDNGIINFHYLSPSSDVMSTTEIPSEIEGEDPTVVEELQTAVDATKLQDIVFTSKGISKADYWAGTLENAKKVLFYHALAGVKFKSANAQKEDKEGNKVVTTILSVTLTNIISEGDCEVTPDQSYSADDSNVKPGSVPKSAAATDWTNKATLKNYTLADKGLISSGSTSDYNFDSTFYGNDTQRYGDYNINSTNYADTFFLVPQEAGEGGKDVYVIITYTLSNHKDKNGNPIAHTRRVKLSTFNWEAGNIYTYTLSANHVDIEVKDFMTPDAKTKHKLTITNTGNTDCYMRAAIIGNWYDNHGDVKNADGTLKMLGDHQIVATWSGVKVTDEGKLQVVNSAEGTFDGIDTENWIYSDPAQGGDGFFYYKYKVKPGNTTKFPLFVSFTVGECPNTIYKSSAHLEMDILAQNFDASKLATMTSGGWWKINSGSGTFVDTYDDEL